MRARLKRLAPGWGPFVPWFYWGSTYLLRAILWIVGRWTVTGRQNVPCSGPVVVVCNHLSNTDPPILSAAVLSRRVRYMGKIELFHSPLAPIVHLFGAFPVRRFESDMGALLAAERILRHGGVLGMFPEGHRSRTGYIGQPHPGTAMIALRSGATVLPCAITGTEQLGRPLNLLRKPRISVHIGTPIVIGVVRRPTDQQVSELTERIFDEIKALLPAKYLVAYTDPEGTADSNRGGDRSGQ